MAGLWDEAKDPKGRKTRAFVILTVEANAAFKAVHERMPAILAPEAEEAWLDPSAAWENLAPLLTPCPPDSLVTSPAPPLVPGA